MRTIHRAMAAALGCAILAAGCRANAPAQRSTMETERVAAEREDPPAGATTAGPATAAVMEPAASPLPAPATDGERAIFWGSPEEPPPAKRTDDTHYVHSNEQNHELFFPYIRERGGGYVGVGSDQNYTLAAHARSEWVWLMDYDTVVNRMHRVVMALVLEAGSAAQYMALWEKQEQERAVGIIEKACADEPDVEEVVKVYRTYRRMTAGYNQRVVTRARAGKCAFWLSDEGSYEYIRALVQAGRMRPLRGDLRNETTLGGIGKAAADLGTTIRVFYLSDAESFFHYTDGFRASVASLPMDERSVILRTASGNFFGVSKADYQWHYNVQSGLHLQGILDTPGLDKVYALLKKGKGVGVEGVTITGFEHVTEALAIGDKVVDVETALEPSTECGEAVEGMACVPAGWFVRGADDSDPDRRPQARVWVSAFWIDLREVTNEDFDACIKAGACMKHERYKGFMGPGQPAVGITWFNAHAYCAWAGKRLPTEAEWEKAARGPDGDLYPWGNEPPSCSLAHTRGCTPPTTLPVGSLPAMHYGIFEMAGNGYEWVQDWYSPCYEGCEGACGEPCTGKDPAGPCGGEGDRCPGFLKLKVLKGGSWFWPADQVMASWRRPYKPESGEHRLSVRCAMTPAGGEG